ncbi:MAG: hypothetical protein JW864_15505 [Spirochaetes bacterium]|nr:hypothetical protein [Spirochaetota bacterium]
MKKISKSLLFLTLLVQFCTYDFSIGPWEDGIIPYYLSGDFTDNDVRNIREAMDSWENVCGVRFTEVKPRSSAYKIVRVSANEWFSSIGENNSNCQMVFGNAYSDINVIIHELGHCLGLVHEHQRPDRDQYVTVIWENILTGKEFNFDIIDNPLYVEENFEYDYHSIMHYAPASFSIDGTPTIIAAGDEEIYRSGGITELDAEHARAIYGPPLEDDDFYE